MAARVTQITRKMLVDERGDSIKGGGRLDVDPFARPPAEDWTASPWRSIFAAHRGERRRGDARGDRLDRKITGDTASGGRFFYRANIVEAGRRQLSHIGRGAPTASQLRQNLALLLRWLHPDVSENAQ